MGVRFDKTLDTAGGGAYRKILNSGPTPSEIQRRVVEDVDPSQATIPDPSSSQQGMSIRVTADGTEVSQSEFDPRRKLSRSFVTYHFNTADASRFNGVVDGTDYPEGKFADESFQTIINWLCSKSGGAIHLLRIPNDFGEYAGAITFDKEAITSAIDKVVKKRGNAIWEVTFDGALNIYERKVDSAQRFARIGENITGADFSGGDADLFLGAKVADKGNGRKKQFGGPGFFPGSVEPKYGADEPATFEADEKPADLSAYDFLYNGAGRSEFGYPLVAGDYRPDKFTWKAENPFNNGRAFVGIDRALLSHPEHHPAFEIQRGEILVAGPEHMTSDEPSVVVDGVKKKRTIGMIHAALADQLWQKYGPYTRDATIEFYTTTFTTDTTDGKRTTVTRAMAVMFVKPRWRLTSSEGWSIDGARGRVVFRPTKGLDPIMSFTKGNCTVTWVTAPSDDFPSAGAENPVLKIVHHYTHGESKIRGHCVLTTAMEPAVEGQTPYSVVEVGDYEKHENVVFNASNNPKYPAPADAPRDDTDRMKKVASNLRKLNEGAALASGSITIWPGDDSIRIGDGTNGGVVVRIEHSYSPYFTTRITLSGSPDVDDPVEAELRRALLDTQNEVKVASEDIRTLKDATGNVPSGSPRVAAHDHSEDNGGSVLANIRLSSLIVMGQGAGKRSLFRLTEGDHEAGLLLDYIGELGLFTCPSVIRIDKSPEGKIEPPENTSTIFLQSDKTGARGFAHQLFQLVELDSPDGDITHRAALNIGEDKAKGLQNWGGDRVEIRDQGKVGTGDLKTAGQIDAIASNPIFLVSYPPPNSSGTDAVGKSFLAAVAGPRFGGIGVFADDSTLAFLADGDEKKSGWKDGKAQIEEPDLGFYWIAKQSGETRLWWNAVKAGPSEGNLPETGEVLTGEGTEVRAGFTKVGNFTLPYYGYQEGDAFSVVQQRAKKIRTSLTWGEIVDPGSFWWTDLARAPESKNLKSTAGAWFVSLDDETGYIRFIPYGSVARPTTSDGDRKFADGLLVHLENDGKAEMGFDSDGLFWVDAPANDEGWLAMSVHHRWTEKVIYRDKVAKRTQFKADAPKAPGSTDGFSGDGLKFPYSVLDILTSRADILQAVIIPNIEMTKHDTSVQTDYYSFITDKSWEGTISRVVTGETKPDWKTSDHGPEIYDVAERGYADAMIGILGNEMNFGASGHALPSRRVPKTWYPESKEDTEISNYSRGNMAGEKWQFAGKDVGKVGGKNGLMGQFGNGQSPEGSRGTRETLYNSAAKWVAEAFSAVRGAHNTLVGQVSYYIHLLGNLATSVWGDNQGNDPKNLGGFSIFKMLWGDKIGLDFKDRGDNYAPVAKVLSYDKFKSGGRYYDMEAVFGGLSEFMDSRALVSSGGGNKSLSYRIGTGFLDAEPKYHGSIITFVLSVKEEIDKEMGSLGARLLNLAREPGPPGPAGPPGERGPRGAPGSQGGQGDRGPRGPPGPAGAAGAKGDKGDAGKDGKPGKDGGGKQKGAVPPANPAPVTPTPGTPGGGPVTTPNNPQPATPTPEGQPVPTTGGGDTPSVPSGGTDGGEGGGSVGGSPFHGPGGSVAPGLRSLQPGLGTPGQEPIAPGDGALLHGALYSGPEGPTWSVPGFLPGGLLGGMEGRAAGVVTASSGIEPLLNALAGNSSGASDQARSDWGILAHDYGGQMHAGPMTRPNAWLEDAAWPNEYFANHRFNPDGRLNLPPVSPDTMLFLWSIGGGGGLGTGVTGVSENPALPEIDPLAPGFTLGTAVRDPLIWAAAVPDVVTDAAGRLTFSAAGHLFPTAINEEGQIVVAPDPDARVALGGAQGFDAGALRSALGIEMRPDLVVSEMAFGFAGTDAAGNAVIGNNFGLFPAAPTDPDGHYTYSDPSDAVIWGGALGHVFNALNHQDGNTPGVTLGLFSPATPAIMAPAASVVEALLQLDAAIDARAPSAIPVPISEGGTGAGTVALAVTNLKVPTVAQTTAFVVGPTDHGVMFLCSPPGPGFNVTVNAPSSYGSGFMFGLKKVDGSANTVTLLTGGANVDGAGTDVLATQYDAQWYITDGTTWHKVPWFSAGAGGAVTSVSGSAPIASTGGTTPVISLNALGVTDSHVAAANKDGTAGTPSMRTLGSGPTQAAGGTDARFPAANDTGWSAMGGTGTRGGFNTATVTVQQLAQVVKALLDAQMARKFATA